MNSQIPTPYVGPRTFLETESDRFFGRDREAGDLLALVVSEQLVVFYAQSGAGKSSLVNTCLIPALRKRNYEILKGRLIGDAPEGVKPANILSLTCCAVSRQKLWIPPPWNPSRSAGICSSG